MTNIDMSLIVPGNNDRKSFPADKLRELADSLQSHGLIQPITVRVIDIDSHDTLYQLVAGERRFRAAQLLGWQEIPANVADLTEEESSAIMLAENVSREDLNPIDEALAYQSRMDTYGWSISDIAKKTGVSQIRIKFRIKLLDLRGDVQELVKTGNLSLGYAQVLSDARLDKNFQLVAVSRLRDNPTPTPSWFRKVCLSLQERQNQMLLIDLPLLGGAFVPDMPIESNEPPTPETSSPPSFDGTPADAIKSHISFWQKAAAAWDELGKPFKRQECEAAARALTFALTNL